jgi:hypothetical protein
MAVCDGTPGWEHLVNFEFIKALTCTYGDAMGMLPFGLLVFGAIELSLYIRTGSVIMPFVVLLLTGGALMGMVAGVATAIATVLVLCAGAGVMTLLYVKFSR